MSAAIDACVECGSSFIGDPIPKYEHKDDCDQQRARSVVLGLGDRCYCLPYGDTTHFRREMGHEVRGVYDGVLYWSCPDCGFAWPRWDDGAGRLSFEAAHYAGLHNEFRAQVRKQVSS